MARSIPTEADLGIAPTDDELTSTPSVEPVTQADDADIPLSDDQPVLTAPDADKAEAQAEKPAAEGEGDKPEKTVDLRALQEARASERELKKRNELLEQRLNAVLSQFQPPQQQTQQKAAEPEAVPGEDDVVGRVNWIVAQLQKQAEVQTQERAASVEQQQRSDLQSRVAAMEDQFRVSAPDYDDALKFVAESRDKELQLVYPYSTAEQRAAYIREEWGNIARGGLQAGVNVPEQIYNLAKARGFTGGQQPQQQPGAAKPQVDPAALQQAQQRHQSLSDAGGGEGVAPIDAKALAAMDDKTFNAWLSQKGNDKKLEAILGA